MLRKVIEIDEEKCNGCGICIPACNEGALQMLDGKARLISDLFCDGLGACIGECPENAIKVIEREAEPYNEALVIEKMLAGPRSVLFAHLKHLKDHNAMEYYNEAIEILKEKGISIDEEPKKQETVHFGCPGSLSREIKKKEVAPIHQNEGDSAPKMPSELTQWPVQLHLVSPFAPYFKKRELVIMSTCGPLVNANVHNEYLKDRSVVVACPKLDIIDPYIEKLAAIFSESETSRAIIVRIEVPCCGGLTKIALDAARLSKRENFTLEEHILGISGDLIKTNIIFKN